MKQSEIRSVSEEGVRLDNYDSGFTKSWKTLLHTTPDIDLHNFQPRAINLHDSLSLTPATIQTYPTVACAGFHCSHVNKTILTQAKS